MATELLPRNPAEDDLSECVRRAQAGDEAARERVALYILTLAWDLVRTTGYWVPGEDPVDTVQGLFELVFRDLPTYDPNLPFRPWVKMVVRRKLLQILAAGTRQKRLIFQAAVRNSFDQDAFTDGRRPVHEQVGGPDPTPDWVALLDQRQRLRQVIAVVEDIHLSELERVVLLAWMEAVARGECFHGGQRPGEGWMRSLGERYGWSNKRIDNAMQRALPRLRRALRELGLESDAS